MMSSLCRNLIRAYPCHPRFLSFLVAPSHSASSAFLTFSLFPVGEFVKLPRTRYQLPRRTFDLRSSRLLYLAVLTSAYSILSRCPMLSARSRDAVILCGCLLAGFFCAADPLLAEETALDRYVAK